MPVVGIYTKDFPAFSGTLADTTLIVVAETGNAVTYRTTIGALRDLSIVLNATTAELSVDELNAAYPNAEAPFQVVCESITDNPLIYIKGSLSWYSIPLGGVAATT